MGQEECNVNCAMWRKQWEVRSVQSGVWSLSLACDERSVKVLEVWSVECQVWVWSAKSAVWSVNSEVRGLEWRKQWKGRRVKYWGWSLKFGVRRVQCEVWSMKTLLRLSLKKSNGCRAWDRVSFKYRSFMFGKLPPPACPGLCYIFYLTFYLIFFLAFCLAVEVQRCTLSWADPTLRFSGVHWAGRILGWGSAVFTGRSQVGVQRYTLIWDVGKEFGAESRRRELAKSLAKSWQGGSAGRRWCRHGWGETGGGAEEDEEEEDSYSRRRRRKRMTRWRTRTRRFFFPYIHGLIKIQELPTIRNERIAEICVPNFFPYWPGGDWSCQELILLTS